LKHCNALYIASREITRVAKLEVSTVEM